MKRRRPNKARASEQIAAFNRASILREVNKITDCARARDARIITLGPLLFFSTDTGDAWMLDPRDRLALCLVRDGDSQPITVTDEADSIAIDWKFGYAIEGDLFGVVDQVGNSRAIIGYPVQAIRDAIRRIKRESEEHR